MKSFKRIDCIAAYKENGEYKTFAVDLVLQNSNFVFLPVHFRGINIKLADAEAARLTDEILRCHDCPKTVDAILEYIRCRKPWAMMVN